MLFKSLITGTIIAFISSLLISFNEYDQRIFVGLLTLIAVGLLGLVWQKETGVESASPVIGIGILVFIVAFFLADNTFIGFRKMTAIVSSFIVTGIFGLLQYNKS